jgi:hypothetical protein
VDRHVAFIGDHLDKIRVAPAHPGIGDADQRDAMRLRFLDRRLGDVIEPDHPVVIAAVIKRRDLGLVHEAQRIARSRETAVLGHVEQLREPGILIAAQRRVEHVVGQNARVLRVVAGPAHRALTDAARFVDAQMDTACRHCAPPWCLTQNELNEISSITHVPRYLSFRGRRSRKPELLSRE